MRWRLILNTHILKFKLWAASGRPLQKDKKRPGVGILRAAAHSRDVGEEDYIPKRPLNQATTASHQEVWVLASVAVSVAVVSDAVVLDGVSSSPKASV
jgi:hypothetical protein